jgi:hypothetical protein
MVAGGDIRRTQCQIHVVVRHRGSNRGYCVCVVSIFCLGEHQTLCSTYVYSSAPAANHSCANTDTAPLERNVIGICLLLLIGQGELSAAR